MEPFRYPTHEGGVEVARLLNVDPRSLISGQDWEYTFPSLENFPKYKELYELSETTGLAKRVLGCFIFQCMEDHLAGGGSEEEVRKALTRLAADYHIHCHEFEYWSCLDDSHYTDHPEDGFRIMTIVREVIQQRGLDVSQ